MSEAEIQDIIQQAIKKLPHAKGMNNHMGSSMTSNLSAMQKVMRSLKQDGLYFLDSVTTHHSQSEVAAKKIGIPSLKRDIFLDDNKKLAAIRQQLTLAINKAKKNHSVIAIGHPYSLTIKVLQEILPNLPKNVRLVPISVLLVTDSNIAHHIFQQVIQTCPIELGQTMSLSMFTLSTDILKRKVNN